MTTLPDPPVDAYADAVGVAQAVAFSRHWYGGADDALNVLRDELTRLGFGDPTTACACGKPINLCPAAASHGYEAAEAAS